MEQEMTIATTRTLTAVRSAIDLYELIVPVEHYGVPRQEKITKQFLSTSRAYFGLDAVNPMNSQ